MAGKDRYGRRPTSTSRGRTDARILAMQHAPDALPGAENLLHANLPEASIGGALRRFHHEWVADQPVTGRRAYERALVLLARDLDANGPALDDDVSLLTLDRITRHISWRAEQGLAHHGDLPRAAVNLARALEWVGTVDDVDAARTHLREHATSLADSA